MGFLFLVKKDSQENRTEKEWRRNRVGKDQRNDVRSRDDAQDPPS